MLENDVVLWEPNSGGFSQGDSHRTRTVHAAMIQEDILNTSRTVPGQMVMRVFMTKRVLKLILLRAPMLRDEASVNSLLWSNMTLPIR
ncbi:hypothetical protein EYF80_012729 [Liparis tanakae]|uniref:Uncharacterized protein n=1 Tax=Liparis tanakae TaxID=230148 RepID=A0A4Z2IH92_9TELE|nr:hypothetical protein EYF80_012729 [Liparis tanakae]